MEVGQTEPFDSTSSQRCRFHEQCKKKKIETEQCKKEIKQNWRSSSDGCSQDVQLVRTAAGLLCETCAATLYSACFSRMEVSGRGMRGPPSPGVRRRPGRFSAQFSRSSPNKSWQRRWSCCEFLRLLLLYLLLQHLLPLLLLLPRLLLPLLLLPCFLPSSSFTSSYSNTSSPCSSSSPPLVLLPLLLPSSPPPSLSFTGVLISVVDFVCQRADEDPDWNPSIWL